LHCLDKRNFAGKPRLQVIDPDAVQDTHCILMSAAAYIEVLQPLYPGTPLGNYRFG
jgi:hypothetical protein